MRGDRIAYLHPMLQAREAGDITVECGDLRIHREVVQYLLADSVSDFGIGVVEKFAVSRKSLTAPRFRKARQRSPSNLSSNSQFASEKRRSISVASIVLIHSGCGLLRSRARCSGGRMANRSVADMSGSGGLLIQLLNRPPTQN